MKTKREMRRAIKVYREQIENLISNGQDVLALLNRTLNAAEELESQCDNLREESRGLRQFISVNDAKWKRFESERGDVIATQNALRDTAEKLGVTEMNLKHSEDERKRLQEQFNVVSEGAQHEVDRLLGESSRLIAEASRLSDENERLNGRLLMADDELAEMKAKCNGDNLTIARQRDELLRLRDESKRQIELMATRLSENENAYAEMVDKNTIAENQIDSLCEQRDEAIRERDEAVGELERSRKEFHRQLKSLSSSLRRARQKAKKA